MNDREFAIAEAHNNNEAAQVPVVERNQCDGCNRGLQVCDDGLHREPSGHPVMACTRNKYTRSIPATELDALLNAARALDALLDRELHVLDKEVVFPFESHTQAWNHIVDARQISAKAIAIAKENGK